MKQALQETVQNVIWRKYTVEVEMPASPLGYRHAARHESATLADHEGMALLLFLAKLLQSSSSSAAGPESTTLLPFG